MSRPSPTPVASGGPSLEADIAIEDDRWRAHGCIEAAAIAAARAVGDADPAVFTGPCAATIQLTDDASIAALNAQFRNKDAATNVLSFPAGPTATEPGAPRYLGDIAIARETVEREARDLNIPVTHHLQHLMIHGLLHLAGHDHLAGAEAEIMEAIETRLLAGLGVPDPYALHDAAGIKRNRAEQTVL